MSNIRSYYYWIYKYFNFSFHWFYQDSFADDFQCLFIFCRSGN